MNSTDNWNSVLNGLWLNIQQEIDQAPEWGGPATEKQLKALNSLVGGALDSSENGKKIRLAVIQKLSHRNSLDSTKELSKWEAACIITFIKDENSWEINPDAERLIQFLECDIRTQLTAGTTEEDPAQIKIDWDTSQDNLPDL
jgi:hypothetical protein